MAESDRQKLLARALDLANASAADFAGGRRAPGGADPSHLKIIKDTSLRTRLIDARVAEGLQSPKGPQKIASIIRVYPNFNAPPKGAAKKAKPAGKPGRPAGTKVAPRNLPSLEEMERLVARLREVEAEVTREMATQVDHRVEQLKRSIAGLSGDALETAHRELGEALQQKRALHAQIRSETFRRVESDGSFPARAHLRLLAKA
jgi:hypothetical protein